MSSQIENKPTPGPDQVFYNHLNNDNFSLPKCLSCGEFHFFPRILCPHCGDFELEWQTLSGKGKVYSTTTTRRKPERGDNYNVSLITLQERPRMMSRVEGIDSESVSIGDMVGGSSFVAHTLNAAMVIKSGLCEVALVNGNGGVLSSQVTTILGTEATL